MIVAVTSMGDSLDEPVAYRLSRSPYYLIVDTDDMSVEPIENMDRVLDREISDECLQLMVSRGVECLVTGHCGPAAFEVFKSAGILIIPGVSGTVAEAVEQAERKEEGISAAELRSTDEKTQTEARPTTVSEPRVTQVDAEEYLSMRAEMVVMQRKLLELHRRVDKLEKRLG